MLLCIGSALHTQMNDRQLSGPWHKYGNATGLHVRHPISSESDRVTSISSERDGVISGQPLRWIGDEMELRWIGDEME